MKGKTPLVERIAAEIMAENGCFSEVSFSEKHAFSILCEKAYSCALRKVRGMNPSALGIISASGKAYSMSEAATSLYQVHSSTYLEKKDSGKQLLRKIAATAIAAKVADLFLKDHQSSAESEIDSVEDPAAQTFRKMGFQVVDTARY